jgi:hypothetical protein
MKWTITFQEQYAEVITTGIADGPSTQEMAKAMAVQLASHKMTRVLMDHRSITDVAGKMAEVYERQEKFQSLGVAVPVKIAEIANPNHMHFFSFLKTVLRNRGYDVEIFIDRESALAWLLTEHT